MSKHKRKKQAKGNNKLSDNRVINQSRPNSNVRLYLLSGIMMIAVLAWLVLPTISKTADRKSSSISNNETSSTPSSNQLNVEHNIDFKKEGELTFLRKNGDPIRKIDIELATTETERDQGMMYRQNLPDGQGMLFIFDKNKPQAFWMKNTYVSLDIIYVDSDLNIVSIVKNAQPLVTTSLPSKFPAQYVVEVVGGFSDGYGLNIGDRIDYNIIENIQ